MRRFGGLNFSNPYEKLAGLRQQSSIEEYIQQFEYMAGMVPGLLEQAYVGNFIRDNYKLVS